MSSMSSYVASKVDAVFSPTPLTPGMLSELSPTRPLKSTTCDGLIPHRSAIAASS